MQNDPVGHVDLWGLSASDSEKSIWQKTKEYFAPAVNFDFGIDYAREASQSWQDGEYLKSLAFETTRYIEAFNDLAILYGGYKIVSSIPMIAGTITSINSNATVVLGKWSEGISGGYVKMAEKIGGKCFQVPDSLYKVLQTFGFGEKLNSAWLNAVINSGARIILNYDPYTVLNNGSDTSSYAMEIRMLDALEYTFKETVVQGIKCWEVTK